MIKMQFAAFVVLFAAAANAALIPVNVEIPLWKLNPRLTLGEWQDILAAQIPTPEFVPNYKKGTEMPHPTAGKSTISGRIIGGQAASAGQFPWQVSNHMDSAYFCGGSIIGAKTILTAGHCVDGFSSWSIGAGGLGNTGGEATQTSRDATAHENYNANTITNDIAIIRLTTPLAFSTRVAPVALPSRSQVGDSLAGETLTVSGWGKTSDGIFAGISNVLNYVDLHAITNAECAATYGSIVVASTLCASTTDGHSTCNGDSGGPLVRQGDDGLYTEVGIVSFGSSLGCTQGFPAAFTRVTSYLDWIQTKSGIIVQ